MAKIVSVYSCRGGTGKTHCIANIAAIVALRGYRVCIVDANLQSPGIHVLFGLNESQHSLNDYLWMHCSIKDTAYDVTAVLQAQGHDRGQLYLVPASTKLSDQARILREGYDISLLHDGLHRLVTELRLDYLFVDTHAGLNEETLVAIDQSDVVLLILCPDQQDFQGIEAAVTIVRRFAVPQFLSIVNKAPAGLNVDQLVLHLETIYGVRIAEVLPHSDELLYLASRGVFALSHPTHRFNCCIKTIAEQIMREIVEG